MKNIKFYEFGTLKSDWMLILAPILILLGYISNFKNGNILMSIGFLSIAFYFIRPFLFRNYLGWNKLAMQIKIDSLSYNLISFKSIRKTTINNGILSIESEKRSFTYSIRDIEKSSVNQLLEIIKSNMVSQSE